MNRPLPFFAVGTVLGLPTILTLSLGFFLSAGFSLAAGEGENSGEQRRVPWTASRIRGTPDPPLPYVTERVYSWLALQQPTTIIPVPGTDRLIAVQLEDSIVSFSRDSAADTLATAVDMSRVHPEHSQTFGIAFHPEFPVQPWCYLTYMLREHDDHGTRLARFRVVDTDTPRIDPDSELLMASWSNRGHRGGCIEFGPDGYLYVPIGDGTPPNPPDALMTGQDISDLQSSILRIDVAGANAERPYRIPTDNPFVKLSGARGEVWAYGFRNPWKISFDPATGSLWAGDVGWELMEMVYLVKKGGNYGWSVMEGSQPVHPAATPGPTPIQSPVVEHTHVEARSVTGGYFYYGDRLPDLRGAYVYGDYMTGKIWALKHDGDKVTWHREIADTPLRIISFALEPDGEIEVVGFGGTIHRLIPNPRAGENVDFPRKLSETGLFSSTDAHRAAPGVIAYTVNAEHWADFTSAERLLALPEDSRVSLHREDDWAVGQNKGDISFPDNAVLAKTISLELEVGNPRSRRRLETQVLHRDGDTWRAYNYVWDDDQRDAVLRENVGADSEFTVVDPDAPGGKRRQTWHHSSRDECLLCHIWRSGTVHGFKLEQLDRRRAVNERDINQLDFLQDLGIFSHPVERSGNRQVSPYDESMPLGARARSYLHLNCAHCHRDGGGGTATFDIRQELSLDETRLLDAPATQGTFGIAKARIIAAGQPYRSVLYYRMAKLGRGRMPQFGTSLVDREGLRLIHDWIQSLGGRPVSGPAEDINDSIVNRRLMERLTGPPGQTKSKEVLEIGARLLKTTGGALMLASALNDRSLSGEQGRIVLEQAARHTDSQIRDLFERFLPASERARRLGGSFDVGALLARDGDQERGRELFFRGAGVECRNCHQVGGVGGQVGPSLDGIGRKYSTSEILENIVTPSRRIDPQYLTHVVQTADGIVASGLMTRQSETEIVLRDATGKDRLIARDDIEFLEARQRSLMPEQLFRDFTEGQAADMLAFLKSLKQPLDEGRKSYRIRRANGAIEVDGHLRESAWRRAPAVGPFEFTWWKEGDGPRQPTRAMMLWDDQHLYVAFVCTDTDIRATRVERDSQVYRDDCVEVFGSPFPDHPERYFNLEINVNGARLDNFRPDGRSPKKPWNPDGIQIATSIDGTLNDGSDIDQSWTVEVAFPFAALGDAQPRDPPRPGDRWRLNLHRLENDMRVKSQWSRGDPNRSSFHTPRYFGDVTFVD